MSGPELLPVPVGGRCRTDRQTVADEPRRCCLAAYALLCLPVWLSACLPVWRDTSRWRQPGKPSDLHRGTVRSLFPTSAHSGLALYPAAPLQGVRRWTLGGRGSVGSSVPPPP